MNRCRFVGLLALLAVVVSANNAAPAQTALPALREDAIKLDQPSNAERLKALTALLRERELKFEAFPFPNARQDRDAREQGQNLVMTLGAGARTIIVGAHFDAARLPDGQMSHAMVDNAASVSVLIHAARALRQEILKHRVQIVFFDMEEIGLVGSKHFAATLEAARIAAMVNLDIAGYGNTLAFGPSAQAVSREVYAAMWQVCAQQDFACVEFPQFPPSDDRNFQAAKIPNISLAVLPRIEAHQLWLRFNGGAESGLREGFAPATARLIHTKEDTAEKLDAAGMTLAYQAVLQLVRQLDAKLP
ncbi:MAG: M28 family metallopeptidase [Blastocatellia bacterium]